jgi:hypothetical protein
MIENGLLLDSNPADQEALISSDATVTQDGIELQSLPFSGKESIDKKLREIPES